MSSGASVVLEKHSGCSVLTLDQPESLNSLSGPLLEDLQQALATIRSDQEVRCAVITGSGKAFCAGADIKAMNRMDSDEASAYVDRLRALFLSFRDMPQILIAAVNGYALGGGAELMINCDLVYASEVAKIGFPEVKLGLIPGASGTALLGRLIGQLKANDLLYSGRVLTASEAKQYGLVNEVVKAEDLKARVEARSSELTAMSPLALSAIKNTARAGLDGLEKALHKERQGFKECFASEQSRQLRQKFEER